MLLLLFNSSVQGALVWSGPDPLRTVLVEPEFRRVLVV